MTLAPEALNHLLAQNSWAIEQLQPHAGKRIAIGVPPLRTLLMIDADGRFAAAEGELPADAEIQLSPGAALRALFDRSSAQSSARIQGDTALASAVGRVLQGLRWDAEEDLSRIIGDIPAHQLTLSSLKLKQELGRQAWAVAGMLSEYWLEEQPLIAKRRHLDDFNREVDRLRDDVALIAKRIEKLEQNT